MSDGHAEGDGQTPLVPVAPIVGIGTTLPLVAEAHADPHSWAKDAERCSALLDRIDAAWSGDGRMSGHQAKEVVA